MLLEINDARNIISVCKARICSALSKFLDEMRPDLLHPEQIPGRNEAGLASP